MSMKNWKKRDWRNAAFTLLLAALIMTAGFFGVCGLQYLLPKSSGNVREFALQMPEEDLAVWTKTEEAVIEADAPYPPFDENGFPEGARLLPEDMTAEALDMIVDLLNHTPMNQVALGSMWDVNVADGELGQGALWTDASGEDWLLWTVEDLDRKQIRVALHPEYGICCARAYQYVPVPAPLNREEMLKKAVVACQQVISAWQQGAGRSESIAGVSRPFFGLSDGHIYRGFMTLPGADDMPMSIVEEESGCRLVYPVKNGQVWLNYDYQQDALSGYAFVPDTPTDETKQESRT